MAFSVTHPKSPTDIHLLPAQPDQFALVARLFEALHTFNSELDQCFALADDWQPMLQDYFERTHDDPQTLWLIAWQADKPVGLLILKSHRDTPLFRHRTWVELVGIYVAPAARGSGLGRRLMDYAYQWTAAKGCRRLQLYVTASNTVARDFYRECGLYPVQEIWRMDIQPAPDASERDDSDETDLLEPGHPNFG